METTKTIFTLIGTIGALSAFCLALVQYRINQKWKRSEFAADLLETLATDWKLSLCALFLDWDNRPVPVPEIYRAFFDGPTFEHNWTNLNNGLGSPGRPFEWNEIIYRDLFSYFFDYLARINQYIEIDLISKDDVGNYLEYYLREIAKPRYNNAVGNPFAAFIKNFNYAGVVSLLEKFDLKLTP